MEIERKWMVTGWPEGLPLEEEFTMRQGYISVQPTVRIREEALTGGSTDYILCFKSAGGLAREEIERSIDKDLFVQLEEKIIGKPLIKKVRRSYRLPDGRTVLETSCAALAAHPAITQLVLVCGGNRAACEAIAAACPKPCAVVQGGATRADSVRNGLAAATGELVAIHDAARPFVSESVITAALTAAAETGAAAPAVPVKDTVKVADPSGRVLDTPDRATLYAVQTPQVFDRDLLAAALQNAKTQGLAVTDDCSAVEALGMPVQLTDGDEENLKITTPLDLELAALILRRRANA